jgi:multidrug transporter EmrE-like cation transporter
MEALYYTLLFCSALIFSLQFLITRQYQRRNGTGVMSSVRLSLIAYLAIAVFFFVKGCITTKSLQFGFSPFTLLMTMLVAIVAFCCVYMGIKVLAVGDMGIYSVFMMLGSLVLPSLVGIGFYKEDLTWLKGLALACMMAAIIFSVSGVDKSKLSLKAILYYIGIFVMNGMIGVLFTIHQNQPEWTASAIVNADGSYAVNNDVFMTWYGLSTVILCSIVLFATWVVKTVKKSAKKVEAADGAVSQKVEETQTAAETEAVENSGAVTPETKKQAKVETAVKAFWISVLLAAIYGMCNGFGDYFIAIATQPKALGSSVTFPIINGGTILFSTLIGVFLYKEKLTVSTVISLVLVLVATVTFMFV